MNEATRNEIRLNLDYIDIVTSTANGINKNTYGFAMLWFHESYHTGFFHRGDPTNKYQYSIYGAVRATNKIRKEMGYELRYNYASISKLRGNKPLLIYLNDRTISITTHYMPFSKLALKQIKLGKIPTSCYIKDFTIKTK